jgi:hypothetical protein
MHVDGARHNNAAHQYELRKKARKESVGYSHGALESLQRSRPLRLDGMNEWIFLTESVLVCDFT